MSTIPRLATCLYPELLAAAEIVTERWQQDSYGEEGEARCANGALLEVSRNSTHYYRLVRICAERLGTGLSTWNDQPGRTSEQVAEFFHRTTYGI